MYACMHVHVYIYIYIYIAIIINSIDIIIIIIIIIHIMIILLPPRRLSVGSIIIKVSLLKGGCPLRLYCPLGYLRYSLILYWNHSASCVALAEQNKQSIGWLKL